MITSMFNDDRRIRAIVDVSQPSHRSEEKGRRCFTVCPVNLQRGALVFQAVYSMTFVTFMSWLPYGKRT